MTLRNRVKVPDCFEKAVVMYGNLDAQAPNGFGNNKSYVNCWNNWYLIERLYNQWRYFHALSVGARPARTWFYDAEQKPNDWRTTVMKVMNAEYAGNASYEWFEWKEDENGERQRYRVNQFDRVESTKDSRLDNPMLDYVFDHPRIPLCSAIREFKKTLPSEKKN